MSLINRLVRILPKKQVTPQDLDRKSSMIQKIEPVQTIKKNYAGSESANQSVDQIQEDGMVNGEYEILEREIMPEKIICPDCGGVTLEGLEFCDKCGGDLTNI